MARPCERPMWRERGRGEGTVNFMKAQKAMYTGILQSPPRQAIVHAALGACCEFRLASFRVRQAPARSGRVGQSKWFIRRFWTDWGRREKLFDECYRP